MITRRRRGLLGLIAVVALAAASFGTTPAAAQDGGDDPTPLPGFEEYEGCPLIDEGFIQLCLSITVDGSVGLGDVGGDIEDLHLVLGVGAELSGDPVIVPAEGGGGPSDVVVSGGLLGIPALDALLELDVLQLLSLSATPMMGDLEQQGLADVMILALFGAFGLPEDDPVVLPPAGEEFCSPAGCNPYPELGIGLPLTVQLNNLLLGNDCSIGPVDLALTTGTTSPPEGVDPLTGASGVADMIRASGIDDLEFHVDGMEFVGNEYEVPGSDCGGIAGAGNLLGSLGLGNPIESLVNSQAGLPSAAGNNAAGLTVDLHVATQTTVYGHQFGWVERDGADFGEVAIGESATETLNFFNDTDEGFAFNILSINPGTSDFSITGGDCEVDLFLEPGDTCQLEVTFAPTGDPGPRNATVSWNIDPGQQNGIPPLTGVAVE